MMQSYRKLHVWNKSMDLVDKVYAITKTYPKDEIYTLASQMRRSAISIPSNIAEGSQRRANKEFIRFLNIAYASLAELETQLEIAYRQQYIEKEVLNNCFVITAETSKMLHGLKSSLNNTTNNQLQTTN